MLVDLNIGGKEAVIIGGGNEAELKAAKLLDAGARLTVIGEDFTEGLLEMGRRTASVRLVKKSSPEWFKQALRQLKPYVVIVAANDHRLDFELLETARSVGAMVSIVDSPLPADFNMPAIAKIGAIRVAISTGGLSPAMASTLRKRIEHLIKPEDVLQVELQGHVRRLAKQIPLDSSSRRKLAYRVIRDGKIRSLLRQNRLEEAKRQAEAIARSAGCYYEQR